MIKLYELNCLIQSNEIDSFQEQLRNWFEKENGVLLEGKTSARKKNTYFKDDEEKGGSAFLMNFNFNLETDKLNGLKEILSQNNQLIRYLILNKKAPRAVERRRIRIKPLTQLEGKEEVKTAERKKVDLEQIGEKLEEILHE